jgi:hypothetical protein
MSDWSFDVAWFLLGFWTSYFIYDSSWKHDAVKHGSAHYEATTGKFTWNNEVKNERTK